MNQVGGESASDLSPDYSRSFALVRICIYPLANVYREALNATLQPQTNSLAQSHPIVFTHATVIDMTGAPPKSGMTVVVEEGFKKRYRKTLEVVGAMYRAKVGILAGTDILNPYLYPGFSLHEELDLLVDAGLTPFAALQTATVNPAKFFGKEKEFGTIEKGKLADLVLLEANPLKVSATLRRLPPLSLTEDTCRRTRFKECWRMSRPWRTNKDAAIYFQAMSNKSGSLFKQLPGSKQQNRLKGDLADGK